MVADFNNIRFYLKDLQTKEIYDPVHGWQTELRVDSLRTKTWCDGMIPHIQKHSPHRIMKTVEYTK